jgi:MFS family permease
MTTIAETRPGTLATLERHSPFTGIVAVACWVIGLAVIGDISGKDKGAQVLAYYQSHENRIIAGTVIWLIGVGVFVWFLGILRSRLLAAEGGDGRLTTVTFAAGIATAICMMLQPCADLAGVLSKDDLDASSARAIHSVSDVFFVGAEYFLPVALVAFALLTLRTRVFPAWFAWITIGIAIVLLVAPIGWAALIFAFPIWVLVLSFMLWARMGSTPRTAGL